MIVILKKIEPDAIFVDLKKKFKIKKKMDYEK